MADVTNVLQAPQDQSQWLSQANYQTPDSIKARREWANALLNQSMGNVPGTKGGWTIGVRNMVDALVGGQQAYQANQEQIGGRAQDKGTLPTRQSPYDSGYPVSYGPSATSDAAPSDALPVGAVTASSKGDPRGLTAYIKETAKKYGIDPEVALRVAKSEGLSNPVGDNGKSHGAFQLYTGGGLGNEFIKETGLNPADPKNEKATIDYALKRAAQGGWGPWYGARKVGIANNEGIGGGSAMAYNDEPESPAAKVMALALASKGGASGPSGVPAGEQTAQYIDPFAVPRRPHISEGQFRDPRDFTLTPEERGIKNDAYYNEFQPQSVDYMGGKVIVNPLKPTQQMFSPGVQYIEEKGGDSSTKIPKALMPDGKGGFVWKSFSGGAPKGEPVQNPDIKPPSIGPGNGPATAPTAAPPVAPVRPAPVPPAAPQPPTGTVPAPPTGTVPGAGAGIPSSPANATATPANTAPVKPELPFGIRGQLPTGQVASNAPVATAGGAPAPGPAETPAAAIAKAQGALPPTALGVAPPTNIPGPMGDKVAQALATQAPVGPAGAKTAEIDPDLKELRDFSLDTAQRKALIEHDAKEYYEAQKLYTQTSGPRTLNAIKNLELAVNLVKDPRFYSGPGATFIEAVQKIRSTLGKDPGMAAPMEMFNKIISGDVVQELKQQLGGLGQIRLAEINLINQSVANLYNTPKANEAVLDIMLRTNRQAVKVGEVARAYAAGWRWDDKGQPYRSGEAPTNAGLADATAKYVANNPLFTDKEIADYQQTFNIAQQTGKAKPNTKYYEPLGGVTQPPATPASVTSPASSAPAAPQGGGNKILKYDAQGNVVE